MSVPARPAQGLTTEQRDYALSAAMYHLIRAGMWDELAELFGSAGFVTDRARHSGFADVYNDALAASRADGLSPEWQEAFGAWEQFLRRRIERLHSLPQSYAQEVANEFVPVAPEAMAARLGPLRDQLRESPEPYLRKISGPAALGAVQTGVVYGVAFSPDHRLVIFGSDERTLKVWDARSGELQAECVGHTGVVRCVAFSPDGRLAVSGGHDRMVKVWEAGTGRLIATCQGHRGFVSSVAFSPDGRRVASADKAVMVWEAETGQLVAGMTGHANPVLDLGFSADGGLLVSAGRDEQARVWETATGRLVGEYAGHTGDVTSVRFLGGGQRVVSGGADGTVKVWDAASGELTANWIAGDDGITGIAVSPDGELIAVAAGDAPIKTWAAASGQLIAEHLGHRETILAVSLTADGTLAAHTVSALYTAPVQAAQLAQIEAERVIRVWDAATAQPVVDCGGYPGRPIGILFSQDGRSLVSVSDEGAVSVWSLPAGQLIGECQDVHGQVTAAAVAPDGGLVAAGTGDGAVLTWRVPPGRLAGDCQGLGGQVTEVAVSPDGERVAAGNDRGQIMIWDARTGQEVCRCAGHEGAVAGLSFAPDGQVLASGGEERTVREWRSDTGELVTEWRHRDIGQIQSVDFGADGITVRCSLATVGQFLSHSVVLSGERHNLTVETRMMNPPGHAATSPDGRLRAASDRLLVFWADRQAARLAVGDDRASDIAAVAFSADGQRVAWGMREVTVQERATGREFPRCTGHKYDVTAIAFAPDGCTLASGGRDNTVKVWDVETGVCTADLTGLGGEPTAVAFSPDGQKLAVATLRGGVSAWDLTGQDGDAQAGEAETARDVAAGAQTAAGTARLLFEDTKTLSYVSDIGFAPSGKLVIASGPTVLGWNVETGQVMGRLPGGEEGEPAFRTVALLIGLLTVSVRTVDLSPLRQPAAPGGEGGEP